MHRSTQSNPVPNESQNGLPTDRNVFTGICPGQDGRETCVSGAPADNIIHSLLRAFSESYGRIFKDEEEIGSKAQHPAESPVFFDWGLYEHGATASYTTKQPARVLHQSHNPCSR